MSYTAGVDLAVTAIYQAEFARRRSGTFHATAMIPGRTTMLTLVKTEFVELYGFLKRNRGEIAVASLAVLFLVLNKHHAVGSRWQSFLFYFALLPISSIVLILRRNPLDFGLRLGHYRLWGLHLVLACPAIFPVLYLASKDASVRAYYQARNFDALQYALETAAVLFAWEFICRGFLLFGLKDRMKEGAIMVQMIPFVLLHLGKPEGETISCIVSGIYFGYLAFRGDSFWPAFIIHLYLNLTGKALIIYGS